MAEVSTVQQLPAPFIEAAGKTYLADLQSAIGGLRGADLSTVMGPQFVAPTSAITQEAQALRGGLGSFAPFLQTAAATTGPTAYQQFMSPYQQDIISTTLRDFDVQAAKGLPALRAQAIGSGAFGGGREGVQLAEYQATSDRNRAALQAQLQQQGFTQANQLAQQNFLNQLSLAQQAPALAGQQISALGALGTQQQAQDQAVRSAQQQLAFAQQQQPLSLAQTLGSGVTSLIAGYPAQFQTAVTPTPSPLQTALGAGATLAGYIEHLNNMSNVFKRPMFRKGGTTGGGIMDNVVERGQYANSNIKDLSISDKINLVESLGGSDTGLGDPLTQFLLQIGPRIGTQTGKGGLIPNLLAASEKPIADLIKAQRDKRKTRQAIGLEFIKDLSDSDKIALQEKVEYLMSEEGGGFSKTEAFNRVLPEFRKSKSPTDIERDETALKLQDIIDVTSTRTGPTLTTNQANLIYNDELRLEKANPEAYNKFLRTSSKDKYVYGGDEYEGDINSESGAVMKENSVLSSLPENTYVYDITTGNFIYRQGKRVLKLDLDIVEE